jgi:hypothetical protein
VAKGQIRSNREVRKPKKSAAAKAPAASVTNAFAKPAKAAGKAAKR